MHYIVLAICVLIGLYGLYRFFLNASVKQMTAVLMVGGFLVICAALFYLAITGRLPAALGLLAALWPFVMGLWNQRRKSKHGDRHTKQRTESATGPMTRREALEILDLEEGAGEEAIRAAYKRLVKKVHPDQEGSRWMAAKLNQARDVLLKNR